MTMKNIQQFKMPSVSSLIKKTQDATRQTVADLQEVRQSLQSLTHHVQDLRRVSPQVAAWQRAVSRDVQRWQSQVQPTIDKLKQTIDRINR